jgi:hypothetical protein
MAKARKIKQLSFTMPNKVGLLSEISTALTSAKVNMVGLCAYEMYNEAYFMLVTDSTKKAKKVLAKIGVKVREEDAVITEMPNKAGALQKVAKKIADAGININYLYGTAGTGRFSMCVLKTSDDRKAVNLINK